MTLLPEITSTFMLDGTTFFVFCLPFLQIVYSFLLQISSCYWTKYVCRIFDIDNTTFVPNYSWLLGSRTYFFLVMSSMCSCPLQNYTTTFCTSWTNACNLNKSSQHFFISLLFFCGNPFKHLSVIFIGCTFLKVRKCYSKSRLQLNVCKQFL